MAKIGKPRTTKGLAKFCAKVAQSKIANDIIIMDLTQIETSPADYFVIGSCESDVQVRALTDEVLRKCRELKIEKPRLEGQEYCNWVIVDFFDVAMHIMLKNSRNYYKIEKLWGDAAFYTMDDDGKTKAASLKDLNLYLNTEEEEEE